MKKVIYVKANERYSPEYCTRTVFVQDEDQNIIVKKIPSTKAATEHVNDMYKASLFLKETLKRIDICNCEIRPEGVVFPYVQHQTDWLHELKRTAEDKDLFVETWKRFFFLTEPETSIPFFMTDKFRNIFGEGACFIGDRAYPISAMDITPSNLLITGNKNSVLIDYEWFFPFPVPIKVIQYHAVKVTIDSNPSMLQTITREELYKELNLYDENGMLNKMEAAFFIHIYGRDSQLEGMPYDMAYKKGETIIYDIASERNKMDEKLAAAEVRNQQLKHEYDQIRMEAEQRRQENNALKSQNHFLSEELERTQNQLLLAWNSKSWKITAPLRFLKRVKQEKKNPITESYKKIRVHFNSETNIQNTGRKKNWMPKYSKKFDRDSIQLTKDKARRICIMYFYDKESVADGTAILLANKLKESVDRIVLVVGGSLEEGKSELESQFDQVYYKKNEGYDFWGYREGMLKEGWKRIEEYDELILCNFTIMGPVQSIGEVFDEMAMKDCDFWGITSHSGMEYDPFMCNPYGYIPEHIQSYFFAFRQKMVKSKIFHRFWERIPKLPTYNEAVGMAETVLTHYFEEAGFEWKTYVDGHNYYALTDNPLMTMPVELIRDWRCPFFKNRVFFQDYDYYISNTCGQTAGQLFEYLSEEKKYDIDLLWKHLLRTCHMADLSEKLHLSKVLSTRVALSAPISIRTAAIMHVYDTQMLDKLISYSRSLPRQTDIYISTTDEQKKRSIEKAFSTLDNQVDVVVGQNRGRDISGFLVLFREIIKKYDLVCITHDKQTAHLQPLTVGKGFAYAGYTNILGSANYVRNIIECFETEPRLGILTSPMPYHADFSSQIGHEWGANFDNTMKLAKELGLKCPIDQEHYPCAPFGSNFWFRVDALMPLLKKEWTYNDFPEEPLKQTDGTILHAIERIYPYCAQSEGYYTATVMTDDYARLDLSTLFLYAGDWAKMMAMKGIVGRYVDVRNVMADRLSRSVI